MFALAVPYYHSGVRLTYSPNDKVTLMGGLVNGWNNVVENNTGKTMLGSLTLKPTGALTLVENYIGGPETAGTNDNWRNLSDTILTYTASPKLNLVANYDYGTRLTRTGRALPDTSSTRRPRSWPSLRGSSDYDDASGATTGVAQKLKDVTATLELKAADNLLWRVEYRGDLSEQSRLCG